MTREEFLRNKAGENAFPFDDKGLHYGLSKREYFAAMGMASLEISAMSPEKAAAWCVEYADALIAELNK